MIVGDTCRLPYSKNVPGRGNRAWGKVVDAEGLFLKIEWSYARRTWTRWFLASDLQSEFEAYKARRADRRQRAARRA